MVRPPLPALVPLLTEQEEDDAPERRTSLVPAELHGTRLDKMLVTMADEFSRNHLQHLIDTGHVWVDGAPGKAASRKVLAGQRVEVELVPTAESRAFKAEPVALPIVFEDDHLLVIDKPAGLVVHPAAGNWSGTLLNGLLAHHAEAASLPRAGIVHRLDKDTSGLMVVGKTLPAVTALVRAIAAREVRREYLALVHGRFAEKFLHIDRPLARDPQSRVRMAIVASGKPAQTDVTRLAMAETDDGPVTAVRCKLHTGRTHQIRVHLASRGYPLLADAMYGGRPALGLHRQALHAEQLAFAHPHSGEPVAFRAGLPADLAEAWKQVE
ncbi:RluA family pseudouridine synthase [Piscinibacter sp. HJYY11]|uniref:RluA family pseudouridine synthase n=1 Tax=Piscinibacter sp. HJYY11 TaxID=2801333 RepID=UPI00191DD4FE|nr:RluA family pseudouridine synthase [Piscinibacter sp. HJYY11]MBL0726786.1 RluA family pseudouridine synthase [Piscinibacter sp. HJYY11]